MKKIMLMAAAAGMLLAPVASQAVLETTKNTNYNGVTTYVTNKYEQTITIQGQACFVDDVKTANKNSQVNERIVRCAFSTKDFLLAAGIENGNGQLIRRQNRYTEILAFSNCVVTTTVYDVTNGVCYNFVTNTSVTNVTNGTKCWVYASTTDFDDEETIVAVSANKSVVKILNSSSNSPVTSKVAFTFHDHGTLDAGNFQKNGVGTETSKAFIHFYADTSGDVSNKVWGVSKSSFELYDDEYQNCNATYTTRTVWDAKNKCLETAPAAGSFTGSDFIYHYFPNPCGPGRTSDEGFWTVTVRIGNPVKKS